MLLHISQNIFSSKENNSRFLGEGGMRAYPQEHSLLFEQDKWVFKNFLKNIIVSCIYPNRMNCTGVNNYLQYFSDSVQMRKMYWFIKKLQMYVFCDLVEIVLFVYYHNSCVDSS